MNVLAILPLRDSINLKIFTAYSTFLYFEEKRRTVSFVVVADSPLLSSTINLITGANVVTLPVSEVDKNFDSIVSFANKGSEGVVVITPGNNLRGWIEFCLKKGIKIVGAISNEPVSSIEELCLEQLVTSDVFSGFINFNKRLADLGDFLQIDHYEALIPEYSFAEYHVPKIEYSLTRAISEAIHSQLEKCDNIFSFSEFRPSVSLNLFQIPKNFTVYVAEDAFFNYSFKENIIVLGAAGASVKTFSPALIKQLPDDADLVWITGANIFEVHLTLGKDTTFYRELGRYISTKRPVIIEGMSVGLLSNAIFVANKKLSINELMDNNLNFSFASGCLVELEPHSPSPFFQSKVLGWRTPHYVGDILTQGFYRGSMDDIFFSDIFFPRANILVTQTYIPLIFNQGFAKSLINWANSFK